MNQQQFEEEPSSPLRSQRMTEDEAKAVIALWQQEEVENGGLTTRPAVPDVAEGLDVSIEDVQRLLQQVRAKRQAEERQFALEQYEIELEQIRLAEEERKLAEIRRQRAELQRQWADAQRRQHGAYVPPSWTSTVPTKSEFRWPWSDYAQDGFKQLIVGIGIVLGILWLLLMILAHFGGLDKAI